MPWNARTALEQRRKFVEERQLEQEDFAELCRKYGVSRQTGYKWVKRFEAQGVAGLEDLSREPHDSECRPSDLRKLLGLESTVGVAGTGRLDRTT